MNNVKKIKDWIGIMDSSSPYSLLNLSPDESNTQLIHDTFLELYSIARTYQSFDPSASTKVQEEILAAYEEIVKSLVGSPSSPDLPDPEDVPEPEEIDTDGPVNVEIDDLPVASPYQPSGSADLPPGDFGPPVPVEALRPRPIPPSPTVVPEALIDPNEDVPDAIPIAQVNENPTFLEDVLAPIPETSPEFPEVVRYADSAVDYDEDGVPMGIPYASAPPDIDDDLVDNLIAKSEAEKDAASSFGNDDLPSGIFANNTDDDISTDPPSQKDDSTELVDLVREIKDILVEMQKPKIASEETSGGFFDDLNADFGHLKRFLYGE